MATIDWTEYDRLVNLFRSGSPNIAAAFDENKRIVNLVNGTTPPPPGTLRWKPPGYPNYAGYTTIVLNAGAEKVTLDNSKDYILDLNTKQWSSGSSRTIGLEISGGRNVVVIGGTIKFTGTNNLDDSVGILVDKGADSGIVHLEGLVVEACNPITVRSRREVRRLNCRLIASTWNDDYNGGAGIHPDAIQVWGSVAAEFPCAAMRDQKVSIFTTYQGMSNLLQANPASVGRTNPVVWERYEVDVHPKQNKNGSMDAGSYFFHCDTPTGNNNGPYTQFLGEVYSELPTFNNGAGVRGIDDIAINRSMSPVQYFPYEIHKPDGTVVYTSPNPPTGGSGRAEAKQVGNYLKFGRVPALSGQKLFVGKPPGGEFCPASVPGPAYVSPGYL